jgi:hypothetical protein
MTTMTMIRADANAPPLTSRGAYLSRLTTAGYWLQGTATTSGQIALAPTYLHVSLRFLRPYWVG